MTLGQEFAAFVAELVNTDGDFGSTMVWRHVNRTETASTGVVTESAPTNDTFRGAPVDPVKVQMFSDDTLAQSSTAILVPGGALTSAPKLIDRVALDGSLFHVVVEIKTILGPGDSGPPVTIAYVVALGGIVEED